MSIKTSSFLITSFALLISGCCSWDFDKKDFEFSKKELAHLGPYKRGDTVYFESKLGDNDTMIVVNTSEKKEYGDDCFVEVSPHNLKEVMVKQLWRNDTSINKENRNIDYQTLIRITKYPLQKKTDYSIRFRGFFATGDTALGTFRSKCQVGKHTIEKCYEVKHDFPERITRPEEIKLVYWTDKHGLTAYTNKSGETWVIKNYK